MEFAIKWARRNNTDIHPYYWNHEQPPIVGAYRKEGVLIEERQTVMRGYEDLKYYPAFTSLGINHRVDGSSLLRDMPDLTWYVEINTLEDLLNIQQQVEHPLKINRQAAHKYGRMSGVYGTHGGSFVEIQVPERNYIIIDDSDANYPVLD